LNRITDDLKIKRTALGLLTALLLALPVAVQAQFTFTTNAADTITITGYTGNPTTLNIPSSTNGYPVTSIGSHAFVGFTNLTAVRIPSSVISIGGDIEVSPNGHISTTKGGAFNGCTSLTAIIVAPNNPAYCSLDGVLLNVSQTVLVQFPGGVEGSYTIPSSVTNIVGEAFAGCPGLTNIVIPSGVIDVGNHTVFDPNGNSWVVNGRTFTGCTSLTAITVVSNNPVFSSWDGVLFNVDKTMLLQFPNGLGGNYTMPSSVKKILNQAFDNCSRLTRIYCASNAPDAGYADFSGVDASLTVYYLAGTTGWGTTFAGVPTALWPPAIQTADASFGIQTNHFGFNINWASEQTVVVDACTNLANPAWQPVQTNTLPSSGTVYFSDPQWTNYPGRCYRLRSP
jgi:hypothetical protein